MCGIFCSLGTSHHLLPNAEIKRRLVNRGPDSTNTIEPLYRRVATPEDDASTRNIQITLCSTVLSLRGSKTVTQPYQDPDGKYTLCWNGEAWSIDGESTSGNDTLAIHRLIGDALTSSPNFEHPPKDALESARTVADVLSRVAGPYAFAFYDHAGGRLFFGRDFLGRRSLLRRFTNDGDLTISSVSDGNTLDGWTEIEANGVYCIDLNVIDAAEVLPGTAMPSGSHMRPMGRFSAALATYRFTDDVQSADSVTKSVIPRLSLNKDLQPKAPPLSEQSKAVACLEHVLKDSLRFRVLNIPDPSILATNQQPTAPSRLAILFSGGLDCTVLARMSHDLLPQSEPIDLLNVAFENPRIHKDLDSDGKNNVYELCPDRVTGRASYHEVQQTCPGRQWRFVAIDIPYTETTEYRQEVISLMYPHNTEMDLSISLALYFAARGKGQVCLHDGDNMPYTTTARVLLSGLGADELFGGYTRHATAFRRGELQGLLDELELDVSRLGQRNLGRDDRIMANCSREVRFPYLDERLLSWALEAPVTDKCGFGEPEVEAPISDSNDAGTLEPGKKVLRCLAWKLGMQRVAREKKRAIQFGSRTAKMETRKTKGTQLLS